MIRKQVLIALASVAFLAAGITVRTAWARGENLPTGPPPPAVLGEEDVKQLLVLLDQDHNGKISKQEFMKFMSAEFDRLDKDRSGELDVKELKRSELRASHPENFASVGK